MKAGLHYDKANMERRLNSYRQANEAENGDPSISDFFNEYKNDDIEILDLKILDSQKD